MFLDIAVSGLRTMKSLVPCPREPCQSLGSFKVHLPPVLVNQKCAEFGLKPSSIVQCIIYTNINCSNPTVGNVLINPLQIMSLIPLTQKVTCLVCH